MMEVEIFVGESHRWVVIKYPEVTPDNASTLEALREYEEAGDTFMDLTPGKHTVAVVWQSGSNHEANDDHWIELFKVEYDGE